MSPGHRPGCACPDCLRLAQAFQAASQPEPRDPGPVYDEPPAKASTRIVQEPTPEGPTADLGFDVNFVFSCQGCGGEGCEGCGYTGVARRAPYKAVVNRMLKVQSEGYVHGRCSRCDRPAGVKGDVFPEGHICGICRRIEWEDEHRPGCRGQLVPLANGVPVDPKSVMSEMPE